MEPKEEISIGQKQLPIGYVLIHHTDDISKMILIL